MAKTNVVKNYIYNLIYQIVTIITPLITTPYLSRVLGAENIGIYGYTSSILSYFTLIGALGVLKYGQREIAYVQDNRKKMSKVFWEINALRAITNTISVFFFIVFFCIKGEYAIYYRILVIELIANMFDISWFFQGIEEFKKIVMRNVAIKLIGIVFIFLFVKSSNDLAIYILIYVVNLFLGNLSLWLYLPKYINKVKFKYLNIKKHVKNTISFFVPQIAVQVYTVLDKTMLGSISTVVEVGYYEQAQKVIRILLNIVTSLGTVMMPRMANSFAKGEKDKIKKNIKDSFNFVFLVSIPIALGIILIAKDFVPIFFGDEYERTIYVMQIIVLTVIIIGCSNVIGTQYLIPTKRQKEYTISVFAGAIVNFILNWILIKAYGAIGASIGTVLAELTVFMVQLYFVRKEIDYHNIIKIFIKYLIYGLIMFVICYIVGMFITNSILSITIQCILGVLIYLTLLIVGKDELFMKIFYKYKNKIIRSKDE